MTKELKEKKEKLKKKYNGLVRCVKKKKHSASAFESALNSITLPEGVSVAQVKNELR